MPPLSLKILIWTVISQKLKKTIKDKVSLWKLSVKVSLCNI